MPARNRKPDPIAARSRRTATLVEPAHPADDEERWLAALLDVLDSGLAQVGRNMVHARLVERYGALPYSVDVR
jgi:hypothetical protein